MSMIAIINIISEKDARDPVQYTSISHCCVSHLTNYDSFVTYGTFYF